MSSDYQLHLGDCLEYMKRVPDKSIDLVFADPPYANGTKYGLFDDTEDYLKETISKLMPEIFRVSKRSLITCGVANIHAYPRPEWILSWFTPAGAGSSKWGFACWQPILAYGKDPYLAGGKGRRPDSVNLTRRAEKNGHPCPKPIDFMTWVIERGSFEGETILDPFMGSGTTGIAALQMGRKFIGCEINPDYFEIAKKRIEELKEKA